MNISTPFIIGSAAKLSFGICHITQTTDGLLLLSNPTNVPAIWNVEAIEGKGLNQRITAIQVDGFTDNDVEEDDPSVFEISTTNGVLEGPTVTPVSAMASLPNDPIRNRYISDYLSIFIGLFLTI